MDKPDRISPMPEPLSRLAPSAEEALRPLHAPSRRALHRLFVELSSLPPLRHGREARRILRNMEQGVLLDAGVGEALFRLTEAPEPLATRLEALVDATVALMADPDQVITRQVEMDAPCPPLLEEAVFAAVHALVGHAVSHGMRDRMLGHLVVRLAAAPGGVLLTVEDNGRGLPARAEGEALALLRGLLAQHGGRLSLHRQVIGVAATAELPSTP